MADHIALASLAVDVGGALLLARALAFESPKQWVAGTLQATILIDGTADADRARDTADAQVGLALLVAGFGGQAVDAAADGSTRTAALVSYPTCVALLVMGLSLVRPLTQIHLRRLVRARLVHYRRAGREYVAVLGAYSNSLVTTRYARHPEEGLRTWAVRVFGRSVFDTLPDANVIQD